MVRGLVLRLLGGRGRGQPSATTAVAAESGAGGDVETPWVVVLVALDTVQATIGAARLRDEGIPVQVRQEAASSVYPVAVGILGRIELLVPEPLAARAQRVLADTLGAGVDEEAWRESDREEEGESQG